MQVNKKCKGLTALIIASHEGHTEVVKYLVENKANLDLTEEKGNTALMAALMKYQPFFYILLSC